MVYNWNLEPMKSNLNRRDDRPGRLMQAHKYIITFGWSVTSVKRRYQAEKKAFRLDIVESERLKIIKSES